LAQEGVHLSDEGVTLTFLSLSEPTINAIHCVVINKIDPSYTVSVMIFYALCQHYSPHPGLFLSALTRFLVRGEFPHV